MNDPAVKVSLRKGGSYAFFGGAATGAFTLIQKPGRLEYTWRQNEWKKDWADSVVRWALKPGGEGTEVRLVHSGFPNQEERDGHDHGWDAYWLTPMKAWLEK